MLSILCLLVALRSYIQFVFLACSWAEEMRYNCFETCHMFFSRCLVIIHAEHDDSFTFSSIQRIQLSRVALSNAVYVGK